jgi:hypothetical protein
MEPEIRPLQFCSRYVVRGTDHVLSVLLVTDCEPLARVPDLAREKISLARGIHFCPNFFVCFFCDQRLYIVKNMPIYRVSQEEKSIFWEVILSVILSKKLYMNMCPIPNGFRDRAI